ncbi:MULTISPECIES: alpha/beta-type small acid-soluble spore protein [Paenibacillus]|uniref:Spore protein n=1 Tax=Paenibacillus polymyxa (strain SC2) TaxID=886882 RepID=E3EBQ2_PAEPS|nr:MULTISPECIES: alpha/beta-type small acid-soluble spore protein [Paenibacillus]MCV9949838.1 alpha/beta-type small acid-soluble spore protein [Paenibacillus sp. BT-177]ADO58870.1 spore protein [Paenibacillus polymyxa SC2]AJE52113.1 spore protein [Paenibacillus polymyxa]KAF6567491.1 alpha/beta-type small acid-soluble spore protein [Paenibacillus sp. EKM202P]KAF6573395.1 alpha/beta-type small acid-soluble spore protein [Paenibacillus sp. EKM207P]
MASRGQRRLIPESRARLDDLKYEIAAEFGLPVYNPQYAHIHPNADSEFAAELGEFTRSQNVAWRDLTSRQNGSVGGEITKRLIQSAERSLSEFGTL